MTEFTHIGKYRIPVRNHHFVSMVSFRAGTHGTAERGDFLFWTAVMKKRKGERQRKTFGRAWATRDPGERMRRIGLERTSARSKASREAYKRLWNGLGGGKDVAYIRPSTYGEICKWMVSHMSDAKHAFRITIGGKAMIIQ